MDGRPFLRIQSNIMNVAVGSSVTRQTENVQSFDQGATQFERS